MYNKYTMTNGVRIITECMPYVNSISIGYWIKSGSRYENCSNNGVSHFIEHMLFKGTKFRNAKEIAEEIEEIGGQLNAFTGKEATCFYVKLLDEHYKTGIDVLCDMLLNSNFKSEDIEKEKSVIVEEINMYEDSPEDLVADLLCEAAWGKDSLSYPILGTEKTINSFNKESILEYFYNVYTPENLVISISGNFNELEIVDFIKSKLSSWNTKSNYNLCHTCPIIQKSVSIKVKDIEQMHIALTLNGIELGDKYLPALLAINNYFGGGTSSKLFQELREENALVYSIYSYPSAYKSKGALNIYFALNEKYLNNAIFLIKKEISNIKENGLSKIQIKKAKEQLKGNYILGLESVSSRMFSIGKSEIMLNRIDEPSEILKKIDSLTYTDINEVIKMVFDGGILAASAVGKNVSKKQIEELIWRK